MPINCLKLRKKRRKDSSQKKKRNLEREKTKLKKNAISLFELQQKRLIELEK